MIRDEEGRQLQIGNGKLSEFTLLYADVVVVVVPHRRAMLHPRLRAFGWPSRLRAFGWPYKVVSGLCVAEPSLNLDRFYKRTH